MGWKFHDKFTTIHKKGIDIDDTGKIKKLQKDSRIKNVPRSRSDDIRRPNIVTDIPGLKEAFRDEAFKQKPYILQGRRRKLRQDIFGDENVMFFSKGGVVRGAKHIHRKS